MHNHLRELMDAWLKQLPENNGKNGIPAAPHPGTRAEEVPPAIPDQNVDPELGKANSALFPEVD
jgi:hypothetical protein